MGTYRIALLGIILALALNTNATADLQITQSTVIDSPGVRHVLLQVPEQQRGQLLKMMSPMLAGQPWTTTTYMKGARMRTDMADTTVIVNSTSGHAVTMNRLTHKYSIGPYNPFQKAVGDATCTISPTSDTSTLLGYRVRCYDVSMTSSLLPHSNIAGEIWAAPDLPSPPDPGYVSGPAVGFQQEMDRIRGMPLAYSLVFSNTPAGDIRVTSTATSVHRNTLSTADFLIPSDYARGATQSPSLMPSTGYPLGDGMPLDSLSAVTSEMLNLPPGAADPASATPAYSSQAAPSEDFAASALLGSLLGSSSPPANTGPQSEGIASNDLASGLMGQLLGGASQTTGSGGRDQGELTGQLSGPMLEQLNQELQSLLDDN